ncbi:type II secretion system F family protein [Virgibacillus necropolis]|uniref:type II secretion system F family protein n=1 Tax=Virgibacillus necropolis TaxID=163877 RepID=UPI00384ACFD3
MGEGFISVIAILLFIILLLVLVSFINIWLYVSKRQNLFKKIKPVEQSKKKRKKIKDRIWDPIIKASEYAGPTTIKYLMFVNKQKDELMLTRAGNPFNLRFQGLHGMRFVLFFAMLMFSTFWNLLGMPFSTIFIILLPVGGYVFPTLWIRYRAKERQERISVSMPDFLDTVSVTLQAGVSLDGSLKQVTRQMEGPLSDEIRRFIREVDLGVPRKLAYQHMIDRNNSKPLNGLVNSLAQGGDLGVPVSTTFRVQADDLRSMRGFIAKEKAAKASPQITLVTTFLVVPSVFFLIIGLLILNIIYNPSAFGLDTFLK